VTIRFDSPAALATVQNWFRDSFRKSGYMLQPQGNGFTAVATDGSKVELQLDADGETRSKGRMTTTGS
jgi:hypothetical protein